MKRVLLIAALPAVLLLSACNDTSTPSSTVKTAAYALKMNYADEFLSMLGGNAKATYSNRQAYDDLRARLDNKELHLGDERLVGVTSCGPSCVQTASQVSVMNGNNLELGVTVSCSKTTSSSSKTGIVDVDNCVITDVR